MLHHLLVDLGSMAWHSLRPDILNGGFFVVLIVDLIVGLIVGLNVGFIVGFIVGIIVGIIVGFIVGSYALHPQTDPSDSM